MGSTVSVGACLVVALPTPPARKTNRDVQAPPKIVAVDARANTNAR